MTDRPPDRATASRPFNPRVAIGAVIGVIVLIGVVVFALFQRDDGDPVGELSASPALTARPVASDAPTSASPSASAVPSEPPSAVGIGTLLRVQNPGLRMRTDPRTDGDLVRALPEGAVVTVVSGPTAAEGHDWYEVRHGDRTGWVASGEERDWLAVIRNGRIAFACIGCTDTRTGSVMTVEADGSDPQIIRDAFGTPTWSPDGSQLALIDGDSTSVELLASDGGQMQSLGEGYGPAWSPDGSRLAFINPAQRTIELVEGDEQIGLVVTDHGAPTSLRWSPDGQRLAFVGVDCPECPIGEPIAGEPPMAVFAFEPPGGAVIKLANGGNTGIVHWSADGSVITFLELDLSNGQLEMRDVAVESGVVTVRCCPEMGYGYAISPDESRVAFATTGGIYVAEFGGTNSVVVVPFDPATSLMPQHPRWSPDAQWILYDIVATQGDAIYPAVVRPDGTDRQQLVEHDGYSADWQPVLEALP